MKFRQNKLVKKQITSNQNIILPLGEYHIFPEQCVSEFYYVSNNDACERMIFYYLKNIENIVIDGQGSKIILHGRITPFVLDGCKNVTIKNFIIDYADKYYLEAKLIGKDENTLHLDTTDWIGNYKIEDDTLKVYGDNFENTFDNSICLIQEFDENTKAVAYNGMLVLMQIGKKLREDVSTYTDINLFNIKKTDIGFDLTCKDIGKYMTVGRTLVLTSEKRLSSIIFSTLSENLNINNIRIIHSPSMGIICQLTKDVHIDGLYCYIDEESKGLITTIADATHFVHCTGQIIIENSVINNMMDDATNIHGIYTTIIEISDNKIKLQIGHCQQSGFNPYLKNDIIVVYSENTIEKTGILKVTESKLISPLLIELTVIGDLSSIHINDHVENVERSPEVYINNVKTGNNRPRGFLLTTPKKVVVENCEFYNCAQGIFIAGDTTFWFEAGSVQDITIKNNKFLNCNYGYGDYSIEIKPEYKRTEDKLYHSNITILNNEFYTFTGGAVKAEDVDNLVILNNIIHITDKYLYRTKVEQYEFINCKNITKVKA
jgi:hypothetical protein